MARFSFCRKINRFSPIAASPGVLLSSFSFFFSLFSHVGFFISFIFLFCFLADPDRKQRTYFPSRHLSASPSIQNHVFAAACCIWFVFICGVGQYCRSMAAARNSVFTCWREKRLFTFYLNCVRVFVSFFFFVSIFASIFLAEIICSMRSFLEEEVGILRPPIKKNETRK